MTVYTIGRLTPLFRPIRSTCKTTPNHNSGTLVFPHNTSASDVITLSFDWFTGLSVSFVIGLSVNFGFGFTRECYGTCNYNQASPVTHTGTLLIRPDHNESIVCHLALSASQHMTVFT